MYIQTQQRIKTAVGILLAASTAALAGCGSHGQGGSSASNGTPPAIQQQLQKDAAQAKSGTAYTPPPGAQPAKSASPSGQ